jgi:hypothetical protein
MSQISIPPFQPNVKKLRIRFGKFFEETTQVKKLSEIKPPLKPNHSRMKN